MFLKQIWFIYFYFRRTLSKTVMIVFLKHRKTSELVQNEGTGHYWLLLKIIGSIKTYLVTSNGELLIVKNVRNGSL